LCVCSVWVIETDVGFSIIWCICVGSVQVIKMSVGDIDAWG